MQRIVKLEFTSADATYDAVYEYAIGFSINKNKFTLNNWPKYNSPSFRNSH